MKPLVKFKFAVEVEGRKVVSPFLEYRDTLNVKLIGRGVELKRAPFVVFNPWVRISGRTSDEARIYIEDLPPGGSVVRITSELVTG